VLLEFQQVMHVLFNNNGILVISLLFKHSSTVSPW